MKLFQLVHIYSSGLYCLYICNTFLYTFFTLFFLFFSYFFLSFFGLHFGMDVVVLFSFQMITCTEKYFFFHTSLPFCGYCVVIFFLCYRFNAKPFLLILSILLLICVQFFFKFALCIFNLMFHCVKPHFPFPTPHTYLNWPIKKSARNKPHVNYKYKERCFLLSHIQCTHF